MNSTCESTNDDNAPEVEVIGDENKRISFDNQHNKIKHVCILNIDPRYTVEFVHGNDSDKLFDGSNRQPMVRYPHDAEDVLKKLDPNITVQTVYLTTNIKKNIGIIRRLKHDIDVFLNLYDTLDDARSKIIDYMQNQGIAFTGSSLHCCDPSRIEIKRLCRYNQLSAPQFALLTDLNKYDDNALNQLVKKLGGFPLFVKPEHGYDSKIHRFSYSLLSFLSNCELI
jgi:D-alanine-D-alanine ligase-like ATP-grasp enzyme